MIALIPTNERHLNVCQKLLMALGKDQMLLFNSIEQAENLVRRRFLKKKKSAHGPLRLISLFVRTFIGSRNLITLLRKKPQALIFFNDFLLCEKIYIFLANKLGLKTILVQEGFIPVNNSARYIGNFFHSSPFGATIKNNVFVFSESASNYLKSINKSAQIEIVSDDIWPSRFEYNADSKNLFFLASDFISGSNDQKANEAQNEIFEIINEFLNLTKSPFKIYFVPHPNEGLYDGPRIGKIALGFNSYAIEELVEKMPTYRLDFNPFISPYISEIRSQSLSNFVTSFNEIFQVLENLPNHKFERPKVNTSYSVTKVILNLLDG